MLRETTRAEGKENGMTKLRSSWWLSRLSLHCGMLLMLVVGEPALSQPPAPQSPGSTQTTELTKGLLDLLNESSPESGSLPEVPAEVGLQGEAVRGPSANPLESVRRSMLVAAKFLEQGQAGTQTRQLQGDIVQRLDDLINQFEQSQSSSESNSTQNTRPKQQTKKQSAQGPEQSESATKSEERETVDTSEFPNGKPGRPKPEASVMVDLADPTALQKSVWGHLPERLRMQMQSRMVEQFLPSYREQIEDYFKALLEQER
jgi:hypothetical protein